MSCNLAGDHKYFGGNILFLSSELKAFPVPTNFFARRCEQHAPPKFGIRVQDHTLSQHGRQKSDKIATEEISKFT
jgi:hypothetical protein